MKSRKNEKKNTVRRNTVQKRENEWGNEERDHKITKEVYLVMLLQAEHTHSLSWAVLTQLTTLKNKKAN